MYSAQTLDTNLSAYLNEILGRSNVQSLLETLREWRKSLRWERYVFPKDHTEKVRSTIETELSKVGKVTYLWGDRLFVQLPKDGNVFEHSLGQTLLISKYAKYDLIAGYIQDLDYINLQILGLIHDIGEIVVWDVTYDHKNTLTETQERINGERLLSDIFGHEPEKLSWILSIYAINFDKTHPLWSVFNIYEKFSYLLGGIYTQFHLDHMDAWEFLIHNVLKNQIRPLSENIDTVPSVERFLSDYKELITQLFSVIEASWFRTTIEDDNIKYEEARAIWSHLRTQL